MITSTNPVVKNAVDSFKTAINAKYDKAVASKAIKDATDKMDTVSKLQKDAIAKLEALEVAANDAISLAETARREESLSEKPDDRIINSASSFYGRARKILKAASDAANKLTAIS